MVSRFKIGRIASIGTSVAKFSGRQHRTPIVALYWIDQKTGENNSSRIMPQSTLRYERSQLPSVSFYPSNSGWLDEPFGADASRIDISFGCKSLLLIRCARMCRLLRMIRHLFQRQDSATKSPDHLSVLERQMISSS